MAFCSSCGKPINDGAAFCPNCGAQQGNSAQPAQPQPAQAQPAQPQPVQAPASPVNPAPQAAQVQLPLKDQSTALLLCFFLGCFGIHDFYCHRTAYGVIKLILTLTGILSIVSAIWMIVDLIRLLKGTFTDGFGRQLNLNASKGLKIFIIVILILSVSIIPIGLMAAVAVPKLFGSVAKSKASEMPVAIGTYKNLQEAYITEIESAGSFDRIGYTAPSSNVFEYVDLNAGIAAISKENLNDCPKGTAFVVTVIPGGYSNQWNCAILDSHGNEVEPYVTSACESLVPHFRDLCR